MMRCSLADPNTPAARLHKASCGERGHQAAEAGDLLLAGQLPYRLEAESSEALARAVYEQPPLPPSQRAAEAGDDGDAATVGLPRLDRRLREDLDAIVLKALSKAPAERYACR